MTATEELRRLLDERGVKWMPIAWNPKRETFYHTSDGVGFCADEYADGVKIYTDATVTPEQAIAATLRDGTCKLTLYEDTGITVCSECGAVQPDDWTVYYCWSCGRKVVDA
jgi:hypothetical protein